MTRICPTCGGRLPQVEDSFCPECRSEVPEEPTRRLEQVPVTAPERSVHETVAAHHRGQALIAGGVVAAAASLAGGLFAVVYTLAIRPDAPWLLGLPLLAAGANFAVVYAVVLAFYQWLSTLGDSGAKTLPGTGSAWAAGGFLGFALCLTLSEIGWPATVCLVAGAAGVVAGRASLAGGRYGVRGILGAGAGLTVGLLLGAVTDPVSLLIAAVAGAALLPAAEAIQKAVTPSGPVPETDEPQAPPAFLLSPARLWGTALGVVLAPLYFAAGGPLDVSEVGRVQLTPDSPAGWVIRVFFGSLFFGGVVGFLLLPELAEHADFLRQMSGWPKPGEGWTPGRVAWFGAIAAVILLGVMGALVETALPEIADLAIDGPTPSPASSASAWVDPEPDPMVFPPTPPRQNGPRRMLEGDGNSQPKSARKLIDRFDRLWENP